MRLAATQLLAIAASIVLAVPALAHEPPAAGGDVQSVLPAAAAEAAATVDAFHAALDRGDRQGALALLAPEALIFEEGGAERSRDDYAAEHLAADMAFSKAVPSKLTRRTGGSDGTAAWIASAGRTTGSWKGKAVDRVTTETMILRRSADGWAIVHIHWSSAAAPAN
jgi:ketosteroid isomerase-like protein